MLDDRLVFGIHRHGLEVTVVELDQVIKLNELLECVMRLSWILLLEVLIPLHDWALDLVGNVIEART